VFPTRQGYDFLSRVEDKQEQLETDERFPSGN